MKSWAFVSQKGGSGKSTLCTHLAVHGESMNEIVCIVDLDPQASVVDWSNRRGTREPLVLAAAPSKLKDVLAACETTGVTLVLIDTSSKVADSQVAAVRVADLVVAPTRAGLFNESAFRGTAELLRNCDCLAKSLAVVNNAEDQRGPKELAQAKTLLEGLGISVFDRYVSKRPSLETAINRGKGITETAPKSPAADEIRELWAKLEALSQKPTALQEASA